MSLRPGSCAPKIRRVVATVAGFALVVSGSAAITWSTTGPATAAVKPVKPVTPLPSDTKWPVARGAQGLGVQPMAAPGANGAPTLSRRPRAGYDAKASKVSARAARSTTYMNTDGSRTVALWSAAVNYQDAKGSWQPIDNSVVADAAQAGGLTNTANSWHVHFGTTTQGVAVETSAGSVLIVPVGAAKNIAPRRTADGDGVTYPNAWPGADLTYAVTGDSVQETVVIKSASAGSSFAFAVSTGAAGRPLAGAAATTPIPALSAASGGPALALAGGASAQPPTSGLSLPGAVGSLVRFDAPAVVNSSGEPVPAAKASMSSVAGQVVLSLDAAWLASQPAAAFPVRLDPSVGIGQNNEWSYLSTGYSCKNCANSVQFGNSRASGDTYWRSLAGYDMTGLVGAQVLNAEVDFAYIAGTTNADPVSVYWASAFNYAGAKGTGVVLATGNPKGGTPASGSGLTNLIQSYADGTLGGSPALGLVGAEVPGLYTYQGFNTGLYVTYNHKPAAATVGVPNGGTSQHSPSVAMSVAASTDADGDALQYDFHASLNPDGRTNQIWNPGWQSGTTAIYVVPSQYWNQTVYWAVDVWDGYWQTNAVYIWNIKISDTAPPSPSQGTSAPGDKGVVASTTPTLSVPAATDADGDQVNYNFTISGGGDAPSGRASSGWITSPSWAVPSGVLADGQTYSWSVATMDGSSPSTSPGLTTAAAWSNSLQVNLRLGTSTVSPTDSVGGVTVNLANGNASVNVATHTVKSVGGDLGVSFSYNSQAGIRNGLYGQYYSYTPGSTINWTSPGTPLLSRVDPNLNFCWNQGTCAASPPGLPSTYYDVKWTGYISLPASGSFQLGFLHDDGAKINYNNGATTLDQFSSLNTGSIAWTSSIPTGATSQPVPIEIDYVQATGPAQLAVYVQGTGITGSEIVPSGWLTPTLSTLPQGWALSLPGGAAGYTHATTSPPSGTFAGSVVLTDGEGASHTYLAKGDGGYLPPADEDGVLSKDSAGNLNLADDDGSFYTFDVNGNPTSARSATDSLHPAAASYTYNGAGQVSQVTDPVSGRSINLYYGASGSCTVPTGFSAPPSNMLCGVTYWDGSLTELGYTSASAGPQQLAAVVDAGGEQEWFNYTGNLLTGILSPLGYDWAQAGHTLAATAQTQIGYTFVNADTSGSSNIRPAFVAATMSGGSYPAGSIPMATSVKAPAPDGVTAASSPEHDYTYVSTNEARIHVVGLSTAIDRDVVDDPLSGRTLTDTTATGQTTTSTWAAGGQDLPTSSTDAAGRMSTTVYDWAQRATDTYGPAPAACFTTTDPRVPTASPPASCGTIPHTHSAFDSTTTGASNPGLQASYWYSNTPAKTPLSGPPTSRLTATSSSGNFYASQPAGNLAAGSSEQLSGEFALSPGTDTFSAAVNDKVNDGIRVYVDGQPVVDRWTTVPVAVKADNPQYYWRLGDASGTPVNQGSGSGTATPNSITYGNAGPGPVDPSTSIGVTGSGSSYLAMPSALVSSSTTASVEMWFKTSVPGVLYGMQSTTPMGTLSSNWTPVLYIGASGALHGELWNGAVAPMSSAGTVDDGHWHHVIVTATPQGEQLYLDGAQTGSTATGMTTMPSATTSQVGLGPVYLWPDDPYSGASWAGCVCNIADLAVYQAPLSSTQAAAHYQAGVATLGAYNGASVPFTTSPASTAAGLPSTPHTIRVDYRNPVNAANSGGVTTGFTLSATPSGGSAAVVPDSAYDPRYSHATYSKTDDTGGVSGGAETTATQYGGAGTSQTNLDPVYGLTTDSIVDPGGAGHLNLDTKTNYEAPSSSSGYLRQTASALPSASVTAAAQSTTTAYYGNTATKDVSLVCAGVPSANVNQAGLPQVVAQPTGASGTPVATEYIYDSAGRVAASRIQGDGGNWTCYAYDARGRLLTKSIPAVVGGSARTVTYNYAVGGNPLVTSVSDSSGTVTTTTDLLGRTVSYTDAKGVVTTTTYDQAGRDVTDTTTSGSTASTVTTSYLDDGRVSSVSLDGKVVAVPSYTTAAELQSVSYPTGTGNAGNGGSLSSITRDPQGRETALGWTLPSSASLSDTVTLSQSGKVMTDTSTVNGATNAAWTYAYDADRLTSASLAAAGARPSVADLYGYAGTGGCGADAAAGMDSARVTGSAQVGAGTPAVTTSCTDYASRLTSATGANAVTSVSYNTHGDATGLVRSGGTESYGYDSADRVVSMTTAAGTQTVTYTLDATDRMISRVGSGTGTGADNSTTYYGYSGTGDSPDLQLGASNVIAERYLTLPGGVLLSRRYTTSGGDVWAVPNLHGDVIATTGPTGTLTGSGYLYDPFGQPLDPATGTATPADTPATRTNGPTDAWEGQHQRGFENHNGLDATVMGARVYLPTWGQFGALDPVPGGNANPYTYPGDPINGSDLNGQCYFCVPKWAKKATKFVSSHARDVTTFARNLGPTTVGFIVATSAGGSCSFHAHLQLVCTGATFGYGRGGTTYGNTYVTGSLPADKTQRENLLKHEYVHSQQWATYGLAFPALYFGAGSNACTNRFERQAGLANGGYSC